MAVSGYHTPRVPMVNDSPRELYYLKGSIDAVLDRCKFYYISDDSTPGLDAATRGVILGKAQTTASRGLRVIAMAYGYGGVDNSASAVNGSLNPPSSRGPSSRSATPDRDRTDNKSNLIFVGFQAMFDPPRKGVADAISLLQSGGVQVVMITGDAEQTAISIARDLGLNVGGVGGHVRGRRVSGRRSVDSSAWCLTGKAIDQMSKSQLKERVGSVCVFARTTPRHKMKIVEAYQARGRVVAMTGDGGEG
jgi:P-type Ca2+ transporter type 2C